MKVRLDKFILDADRIHQKGYVKEAISKGQ